MSSLTRSCSRLVSKNLVFDGPIMVFDGQMTSEGIFKQVVNAIKTGKGEMLLFNKVDPEEFAHALESFRHPSNHLEGRCFRIHWFSSENRLKVVRPSMMHESVGSWLAKNIVKAAMEGLISDFWNDTMAMMVAPEFNNFVGEYVGSVKEGDYTFIPRIGHGSEQGAAYPSVVLESGWYESSTRLLADSRLWQEGSAGEVRVVLQAKFYEPDNQNKVRLVLSISRTCPGRGFTLHDYYPIFPAPPEPQNNPSISLGEFYAGYSPPKVDQTTAIPLDLELLRQEAGFYIRKQGYIPADTA